MWLIVVALISGLAIVVWSIHSEQAAAQRRQSAYLDPSVVRPIEPAGSGKDWWPTVRKILIAVLVGLGIVLAALFLSALFGGTEKERKRRRHRW